MNRSCSWIHKTRVLREECGCGSGIAFDHCIVKLFTNARYCSRSRLFIVSSVGLKGKTHGVIGTGFVPRVSAARIFSTEEYVLGIHLLCRFNERLLEDLAAAIRTLCRLT